LSWRFLRVATTAYGIAVLLLWCTMTSLWLGSRDGRRNGGAGEVIGPDFPAFYTAGLLVRNAEASNLYRFERHQQIQRQLFPGAPAFEFGVAASMNPPQFALFTAPLSALPYTYALVLWSAAQLLCVALSLWLLCGILPGLRSQAGALLCTMALLFVPLYLCVNGGQNSGFSLLLHTGILTAVVRRREAVVGLLLALGLYKPQLFVGVIPLLLLAGFRHFLPTFTALTAAIGAITASFCGTERFDEWWQIALSPFYRNEAFSQASGMYSWTAFWELLLGNRGLTYLSGYACAAITFVALAWCWRHCWNDKDTLFHNRHGSYNIPVLYGITVCGIVLMSPHLGAYDLTLLVLPGLVFGERVLTAPHDHHIALRLCMGGVYVGAALVDQALWTRCQFVVPLLTGTALLAMRLLPVTQEQEIAVASL
jgi:hypothetical protein